MNQKRYRDVDQLLGSWSAQQEPEPAQLQSLISQVERSAAEGNEVTSVESTGSIRSLSMPVVWATAACLLLVVSASILIRLRDRGDVKLAVAQKPASPTATVPIEAITDDQRLQKQDVLAELDRLFDGKRVWYAETDTEVILGGDLIATEKVASADRTIAMRLVLARRSESTESWQRVWSADVVSRSDQVVQFITQEREQPSARLTTWTHLLPDGLIACDIDLRWENGKSRRLTDSLLLAPGDPEVGASMNVGGVEYRLFHSASLLGGPAT